MGSEVQTQSEMEVSGKIINYFPIRAILLLTNEETV